MDGLYTWIIVLAIVKAINASCEIIFEEKVNLRSVYETTVDEIDEYPDEVTFEVLIPTDEEPILTFDLELDEIKENCSYNVKNVFENITHGCIYKHRGSSSNAALYQTSQNTYTIKGKLSIGLHTWEFSPVEEEDETIVNLVSVRRCREDNDDDIGFRFTVNMKDNGVTEEVEKAAINGRYRRSINTYTVELLMVIDNAIYSWWKHLEPDPPNSADSDIVENIQQYYAYVLKEIDNRFVSMEQESFEINIAFSGMIITKTDEESYWTTTSTVEDEDGSPRIMVNSSEALEKFQQWLDNNTDLPHYDHAILFTGSNLIYAGNPGNTGLAFEASMCRNISNSSIVEESFDGRTITYAVRQIARSLGVRDDMDNNDCLEFFNFIMAPKFKLPIKSFPTNRWLFSTCSVEYFKEYIGSLNEVGLNCLQEVSLQTRFPLELTQHIEDLPGKFYGAKEQCVNKFGGGSDICRAEIGKGYSKLCSGLMCTVPGNDACEVILPADGTLCGNMKYCFGGECAEFEDAEKRLDTCVFGNQPGENCEMHVSSSPLLCYNESVNYKCCLSCAARETGLQNCEYGDRMRGCSEDECSTQNETYTKSDCCLTCLDGSISYSPPFANFITSIISRSSHQTDGGLDITASTSAFTSSMTRYGSSPKYLFGISSTKGSSDEPFLTTGFVTSKSLEERRNDFGNSNMHSSTLFAMPKHSSMSKTTTIDTEHSTTLFSNLHVSSHTPIPTTKTQLNQMKGRTDGAIMAETSTAARMQINNGQQDTSTKLPETAHGPTSECITRKILKKPSSEYASNVATTTAKPTTSASKSLKQPQEKISRPNVDTGGAMTIYDRIFFKQLARSMRRNERYIRQRVQQCVKLLYASVSRRIGAFQETEVENEITQATNLMGEIPSNDDDDLNRQLKPIWLRQYRGLVRNLETNIKRMRYQVLMMVNKHLRQ